VHSRSIHVLVLSTNFKLFSMNNRRSPHRLETFKDLSKSAQATRGLSPLLDVCTRWGSTYVMIDRAILCKKAYSEVFLEDNLTDYLLEEVEWRSLTSLRDLLGEIDTLTTVAQGSTTYTTISLTIIIYNKVMGIIETYIKRNRVRHPDICRGAKAAYDKLKKYYAATDKSPIYSVVTALHPAMRFHYWIQEKWEDEYVISAKETVRTAWADGYAPDLSEDLTLPYTPVSDNSELALLGMAGRQVQGDELEGFVASPTTSMTPLEYWRINCHNYPRLAKMARDYYATPATSAPAERSFSKARSLLPYTRNRLGPDKIKEQMLLNSWFQHYSKAVPTVNSE